MRDVLKTGETECTTAHVMEIALMGVAGMVRPRMRIAPCPVPTDERGVHITLEAIRELALEKVGLRKGVGVGVERKARGSIGLAWQ